MSEFAETMPGLLYQQAASSTHPISLALEEIVTVKTSHLSVSPLLTPSIASITPIRATLMFGMVCLCLCCMVPSVFAYPPNPKTPSEPRPVWVEVHPVQVKTFGTGQNKTAPSTGSSPQTQDPHAGLATGSQQNAANKNIDPHAGLGSNPHDSTDPHAGLGSNPHDSTDPHAGLSKSQTKPQPEQESIAEKLRILSMRMNRDQNQMFQRLITLIISPCCWTQPVSLHASSMSDTIKADLMQRLLAGHTEPQILDAYKKRFGERVLSIPDKNYIFLIPLAASFVALLLVGFLILRWSHRKASTQPLTDLDTPEITSSSAPSALFDSSTSVATDTTKEQASTRSQ